MTDDSTAGRPSVRRVVLGLLDDYGTITHPLLVATTHHETDASASLVRTTIDHLEREGEIYRVGDCWKVTSL